MHPPVRIDQAQAAALSFSMLTGASLYSAGAGGYGRKRPSARPVPLALRIVERGTQQGSPNSAGNQAATIPLGQTRTKRAFTRAVKANANA